jgi:hypothetical protein
MCWEVAWLDEPVSDDQRDAWITHSGEETEALGASLLGTSPARGSQCRVIECGVNSAPASPRSHAGCCERWVRKAPSRSELHLARELRVAGCAALHLDLYRLHDRRNSSTGLADYHRPGHLWLIEWPEKGAGRLPAPDEAFAFSIVANGHRIERIETFIAKK